MKVLIIGFAAAAIAGCGSYEEGPKSKVSSAMSPCQCMISGGCAITWMPKEGMLYSDKTSPKDYDDWGFYHGNVKVPRQCMGDGYE